MSKMGILLILAWDASINTKLMVLCVVYVPCKCYRVSFSTAGNQTCHYFSAFYLFDFFFLSQAPSLYSYNKTGKRGKLLKP